MVKEACQRLSPERQEELLYKGMMLYLKNPYDQVTVRMLAAAMEIPEARLRELRVRCIENVKKTNGSITMDDAVDYQNGDK